MSFHLSWNPNGPRSVSILGRENQRLLSAYHCSWESNLGCFVLAARAVP